MPASASASASSASTAAAVGAWVTLTTRISPSVSSVEPDGKVEVGGEDLDALLGALDGDLDELGDVGRLGLDGDGRGLGHDEGIGLGLADDVDRHLDGDLLALPDRDEVDVLDEARASGRLHLLGQRELDLALDVDVEQRVGAAVPDRHHRVVAREGHVDRRRCRGRR